MEFKEQYKHPSWQKKRLEALSAASFTCQRCFDSDSQLHVHHKRYVHGRMIWDYGTEELEVLCDQCHSSAHDDKEVLQRIQGRICSEGLHEITSVLSGYLEKINGPVGTGFNSITLDINYDDPSSFSVLVGRLAAVVSNNLGLEGIENLISSIETMTRGETKNILLRRPGVSSPDEERPF